jgi:hypothetical protein
MIRGRIELRNLDNVDSDILDRFVIGSLCIGFGKYLMDISPTEIKASIHNFVRYTLDNNEAISSAVIFVPDEHNYGIHWQIDEARVGDVDYISDIVSNVCLRKRKADYGPLVIHLRSSEVFEFVRSPLKREEYSRILLKTEFKGALHAQTMWFGAALDNVAKELFANACRDEKTLVKFEDCPWVFELRKEDFTDASIGTDIELIKGNLLELQSYYKKPTIYLQATTTYQVDWVRNQNQGE